MYGPAGLSQHQIVYPRVKRSLLLRAPSFPQNPYPQMARLSQKSHCTLLLLLWTISASVLVTCYPIASSSEAREAHVIKDIVENGHWLFPTRAGIIPSKPPLYHWVGAILAAITGNTAPWVGRMVSIFSGAIVALATMRLARTFTSSWWREGNELFDEQSADWSVVRLSLLIVLSSHLFLNLALNARVDMLFVALSTLSVSVILPYTRDKTTWKERGWGTEFLFWFLIGCSLLSRGVVGLVFPTGILFLALWIRLGTWSAFRWFLIPPLLSIIPLGMFFFWLFATFNHWGFSFIERFLFENFDRVSGGGWIQGQPWWFYGPSLLRTILPWSVPFIISFVRPRYHRKELRILLAAVLFGLISFSVAEGKRHSYLLPILPPLAILTAHYVVWELRQFPESVREKLWRSYRVGEKFLLFLPLVALIAVFGLIEQLWSIHRVQPILPFLDAWSRSAGLALAVVWFVVILIRLQMDKRGDRLAGLSAVVGVLPLIVISSGLGVKNTIKDFPHRTEELISRMQALSPVTAAGNDKVTPILVFKELGEEYLDPFMYYARVPVRAISVPRKKDQLLSPIITEYLPEVAQLLAGQDDSGKVPCGEWVLTVPSVVSDARNKGIGIEYYEEFLEPTHKGGMSPQRADRTAVLARFRGGPERCLGL